MIEILIDGKRVFTSTQDDAGVEINRSVFDLLEPDKRKTDFTRTVDIAGSKEADEVFMSMFNVNFTVTGISFDPTKRASAIILSDTIPQLVGYCQLTDIAISYERSHVYKVVFYGVVGDLFKKINGKRLMDIDFSDLNHTLTAANIESTFAATNGEGYVYPLINYGAQRFPQQTNFQPQDFRPWLFWKEIWDRIFAESNIRYNSDFINSDKFKKLIYSCDEPMKIDQATLDASLSQAEADGNQTISVNNTVVAFPTTVTGGGNYTPSEYTAPNNGTYTVAGILRSRVVVSLIVDRVVVRYVVQHRRGSTVINSQRVNQTFRTANTTIDTPFEVKFDSVLQNDTFRVILEVAYVYGTGAGAFDFLGLSSGTIQMRDTTNGKSLIEFRLNEEISNGSQIDIAKHAAGKLLQKDFVMGVIKSFNMFFDPQPDGSIVIEPYDDYYTTDTIDLTKALATDLEFTIKPVEQSKFKRYKYTYKSSGDFLNKAHNETYDEVYGSVEIDIDNDFAKNTKTTELPWSLPVMSTVRVVAMNTSFRVVPFIGNENSEQPYTGNSVPKVLVWGGLKDSFYNFQIEPDGSVYTGEYPYAGQQDELIYTTDNGIDLTFDLPPAVYWQNEGGSSISIIEDNGLYPQYHERYIDQITNRDSKIVECYIHIDPYLYSLMDFRKLYFIRDAYYRLYEIKGYRPEMPTPTECVFLKVEESAKKVPARSTSFFDPVSNASERGNENPVVINRGTVFRGGDGIISTGDNNVISGNNVVVTAINSDIQGTNIVALGGSNQSPIDDTVSIVHNNITLSADVNLNYIYLGVEGSPLFIYYKFPFTVGGVELILTDIPENQGKTVYLSSEDNIDVKDDSGTDIDVNTTGGVYTHMGADGWVKFN